MTFILAFLVQLRDAMALSTQFWLQLFGQIVSSSASVPFTSLIQVWPTRSVCAAMPPHQAIHARQKENLRYSKVKTDKNLHLTKDERILVHRPLFRSRAQPSFQGLIAMNEGRRKEGKGCKIYCKCSGARTADLSGKVFLPSTLNSINGFIRVGCFSQPYPLFQGKLAWFGSYKPALKRSNSFDAEVGRIDISTVLLMCPSLSLPKFGDRACLSHCYVRSRQFIPDKKRIKDIPK